jgi:hypothetical protein
MFGHVSIGVADIDQSKKFHDAARKRRGYTRLNEASPGCSAKAVQL